MTQVDDILGTTAEMDTSSFLRYLIRERFPQKTVVTCSLRARSVVVLKLISEIDPATPIVFCHMPNLFPESREYFAKLVSELGLRDIREPAEDHGVLPGDCDHSEGLWAEDPDAHTRAYMIAHLNEALAGFDCWIRAAYHCPYPDTPGPRVVQEGRLIRIDPLASWSQSQVQGFMQEHGLSYHPLAMSGRSQPPKDEAEVVTTFAF
ncbi:putative Phosphoadenylyl-sulfate reductase (thioredoxin) [Candidatus Filomicrobium marinum]|uniref:Phosphoadenosine phosphosulfate reductase n=2 Tax=Filomicrobium TaxID=119044 RepID=A0A1H0QGL5_9HYPH|nr:MULTISPECIES: phosphoadenosine phosphosulfate reductase family protein [Filomicrobium]MCV0369643.1 phosphoadenosine phosphosulfate reductase family protein [Filomicrobium sp.]CFX46935.1 putative Phosphoadenylyl-sulfate reductase (thioredoxin) [Candidatus Filomicrobium marinum]CPR20592.1 putative Phosphoadenylyl-sulfate reductase (thioredoxin) [Candidatus Filomicrobium marinum]SDP16360.1 phosphoadenosine phosphosulfate reductase [Filomicrobium insigne]